MNAICFSLLSKGYPVYIQGLLLWNPTGRAFLHYRYYLFLWWSQSHQHNSHHTHQHLEIRCQINVVVTTHSLCHGKTTTAHFLLSISTSATILSTDPLWSLLDRHFCFPFHWLLSIISGKTQSLLPAMFGIYRDNIDLLPIENVKRDVLKDDLETDCRLLLAVNHSRLLSLCIDCML